MIRVPLIGACLQSRIDLYLTLNSNLNGVGAGGRTGNWMSEHTTVAMQLQRAMEKIKSP
jgi:hypothetical protein